MAPFTSISQLPTFISPDEHKTLVASTPASFSDIPPVLRHKEENVSVTIDPPLDGFSPEDSALGTLYVVESALVFLSASGRGFQVEYPNITLHAISRAETGPSIYCQIDEISGGTDEQAEEGEYTNMKELIILPRDSSSLEAIFENLSFCASLHPDPASLSDDMDDAFVDANGSTFEVFTGDEDQELSEVGRAALAHLESIIYNPFEQQNGTEQNDAEEESKVNGDTTSASTDET